MNNKLLAAAIVGVLIVASIAGVLILNMGMAKGTKDNAAGDADNRGTNQTTEGKANFVITSFNVSKHNVLTGYETMVTVGVLNNGTADGVYPLSIMIDGAVVKSYNVSLGKGDLTTVSHNVSLSTIGNHTLAVGDNSTYLNCYDQFVVGAYLKYHCTEYEPSIGTTEYNWTSTITFVNLTSYKTRSSYEGGIYADQEYLYNFTDSLESITENLTFVGMESVFTDFGMKTLAHYHYTVDSGGYHFDIDTYRDGIVGVNFKTVVRSGEYVSTDELIDTNSNWVKEL